jgi:hypothetical protein
MTDTKPAGRGCVFCGARPLTAEHVFAAYLQKLTRGAPVVEHTRTAEVAGVVHPTLRYDQKVFDQKVKAVCAACNNGWMAELETAARPLLEPGLRGRGRSYHRGGQAILAAWAFKTGLMLNEVFRDIQTGVPSAHYEHLFANRTPPPGVTIWMTAYGGIQPAGFQAQGMAVSRPGEIATDDDIPNLYVMTLTLGPFAFQIFGVHDSNININPETSRIGDGRVHRLWPYEDSFTWAPGAAYAGAEFERFAEAIYDELRARLM